MDEPNPSHPPWLQEMLADIPWHAPSHWYNYRCHSCDHRDWVEDIIVDGFPPTEPDGCPALICPECGGEFLWNASIPQQQSYMKPESG